jgi:hypothetical protein
VRPYQYLLRSVARIPLVPACLLRLRVPLTPRPLSGRGWVGFLMPLALPAQRWKRYRWTAANPSRHPSQFPHSATRGRCPVWEGVPARMRAARVLYVLRWADRERMAGAYVSIPACFAISSK